MMSRTQITLQPEIQRRARQRAGTGGSSGGEPRWTFGKNSQRIGSAPARDENEQAR